MFVAEPKATETALVRHCPRVGVWVSASHPNSAARRPHVRKLKRQRGLSLVEVTIMLLVLMLLTSVLAPSIYDFVLDAQWVKVKEDCEAIGITVARLTRDVGSCLKRTSGILECTQANRADILFSDGPDVTVPPDVDLTTAPDFVSPGNLATINWNLELERGAWMEDQFVTNAAINYNTPAENYPTSYPVGPLFGLGWRGAYLSSPIGPDPWGNRYLVNSAFLAVATDAADDMTEGSRNRWWEKDVFCLSSGPNRLYQTPFACNTNHGTCRVADDFVYVIQGSGR
jgi:hypothetical protein